MSTPLLRALTVLAALAVAPGVAHAGCPSTGATLLQTAAQATAGFQARDAAAVEASVAELRQDLLCAGTVLDPAQAAAVHRAMALQSFLAGNLDGTRQAFRAARAADPVSQLPTDLVPDGHPLRLAFTEAGSAPASATEALGQRPGQRTWVDGRAGTERPTDRPAIVQAALSTGPMVGSVYLFPGEPLPGWATPIDAAPAQVAVASAPPTPASAAGPAAVGSGKPSGDKPARGKPEPTAAPASSSVTLATAEPPKERRERQDKPRDPDARRGPSKALLFTGLGLGAASAGLWGVAVLDGMAYERHTEDALDGDYRKAQDVEDAQAEIDAHYNRVNALGYAAQAATATTGVVLVASFVF
ncbi:hypothetical protein L6R53_10660 [Myxococcota bacterium]|nr:hypothetical protein [Myxococcota bacterium]